MSTSAISKEQDRFQGAGLSLDHLSMHYGDFAVISDVSIDIPAGSTTCIIGPSGSGKSTLLRGINRLHEPSGGDARLDSTSILGVHPDALRRRIGMVFQHFNLFPDHTAQANVALAPWKVKGLPKAQAMQLASERLADVGLSGHLDHHPRDLSGGQQQRVAIARALAMEPEVMLFDEATSALDPELVKGILTLMERLGKSGMTMVVVTHEMGFARRTADQVVFMDQGKVIEAGPPEQIFDAPRTERLRQFLADVL